MTLAILILAQAIFNAFLAWHLLDLKNSIDRQERGLTETFVALDPAIKIISASGILVAYLAGREMKRETSNG